MPNDPEKLPATEAAKESPVSQLPENRPRAKHHAKPSRATGRLLTVKQRRFCLNMASGEYPSAAKAYAAAYETGNKHIAARCESGRLLRKAPIRAQIRKYREEAAICAGISPASITARVEELANESLEHGDPATALKALQLLAKWQGMESGDLDPAKIAGAAAAGAVAGSEIAAAMQRAREKATSVIDI